MTPTMHLRFVKRRVGANVVRILQQKWQEELHDLEVGFAHRKLKEEWKDVPLADDRDTQRQFPPAGD